MPQISFAIVDMQNANFSDSWTDMSVQGSGYDLRVFRTYNSRTLFSGLFGFGWCSDFESKLEVTADGVIKLTECGAGLELDYVPNSFDKKNIEKSTQLILAEVKKRNPDLTKKYFEDLEKDLRANVQLRESLGSRLNLQGKAKPGTEYFSEGRKNEKIVLRDGFYERTLGDATNERYDLDGRLTHMYDKNGNYIKITYSGDLLTGVTDNNGRKLTLRYDPTSKRLVEIVGPNGMTAKYTIKNDNLMEATNAWKNTFKYAYDDVHNLTRIEFPDKTFKALTYNKDKDWVMTYKNRKGCNETYDYQINPDDPKNHYWSTVEKRCGDKVTNQSKFEFFHRDRVDGLGKYLYRARSEVNGDITDIYYHETFGKPISVARNTFKTVFAYNDAGLLKQKVEPQRQTNYEYNRSCNKVSAVAITYFEQKPADKRSVATPKAIKTVKTTYSYDAPRCNLVTAINSDGQTIKIKYDHRGRIAELEDQSKKSVLIKYEDRFGKPSVVTRPGLGTINVVYKSDGKISKVDSKDGPRVAVQVASVFNSLLDIIAPATGEVPL